MCGDVLCPGATSELGQKSSSPERRGNGDARAIRRGSRGQAKGTT